MRLRRIECAEILTIGIKYGLRREISKYVVSATSKCSDQPATGPRSAVGNVSGYRCVSDCRSKGREFDPGPVPYFGGD